MYNSPMIFDGKAFAQELEKQLFYKATNLPAQAGLVKKPKIVSILVGSDPASELYTRLKSEAAKRCGIKFEVIRLAGGQDIVGVVRRLSGTADGIMVQLPIPGLQGQTLQDILVTIPLDKDVDGLRWEESGMMPATVKAILAILDKIAERKSSDHSPKIAQGSELWNKKFVVVGARGHIGKPLVHFLRERGAEVVEVEWDTSEPTRRVLEGEVVISCVGRAGVVTGEMVKEGVVAIDVGSPKGDMTEDVYQKARVVVRSPGGVGPVTIACLMENAVSMV